MLQGARIAVVVPAYNEARLIGRTVTTVPSYVDHVVVVDDGSDDDTAERVGTIRDARVELVRHTTNRGVGAAIVTGYRHAFGRHADVAAVMAGDAQMPPEDLAPIIEPVLRGDADYVKGNRLGFPGARRRMPLLRWLGNHALSHLTTWATGIAVRDSQCGFTAISRRAAERLPLQRLWPRYGYPNDMIGVLARHGMRIDEVIVRPVYGDEDSGIGWWEAFVLIPGVLARMAATRLTITDGASLPSSSEPIAPASALPAREEPLSYSPHRAR